VLEIMRYLRVYGMYEARTGNQYATYNGLNPDTYTWKRLKVKTLRLNQNNILEIDIDMADSALRGSMESQFPIVEVFSRF
jgi:hypothetical protein